MNFELFVIYIIVWALGLRWGRTLFAQLGILDKPWKDVPARDPVPTLQWVVVIFLFIVLLYISKVMLDLDYIGREFLGLFVWGGIIAAMSVVDEMWRIVDSRYRLSAGVRLVVQVLVAGAARYLSGVWLTELSIPLLGYIQLSDFTSLLATIARFVLFTNAINRSDGIYGLATGMSSIGFLTIFLLLGLVVFPGYEFMSLGQSELLIRVQIISLALFVLSLLATILEYKPRWLLRDVWVMYFGFALGYLSLLWWAKIGTIIVVLALPLFDAIWVMIDRLRKGVSPFDGTWIHLHYRLMTMGRNRHEVRAFIRWWSLFFMTVMLSLGTDRVGKLLVFGAMALIFFGANIYLFRIKKLPYEYIAQNEKGYEE